MSVTLAPRPLKCVFIKPMTLVALGFRRYGGICEAKLRDDGPTLEEYVRAGYKAENYPPRGYKARTVPLPQPSPSNHQWQTRHGEDFYVEECDAVNWVGEMEVPVDDIIPSVDINHFDDVKFPTVCDACKKPFKEDARQMISRDRAYVGPVGERRRFQEWLDIPGTMFDYFHMRGHSKYGGPDGLILAVICPCKTFWVIDGPCNNCTLPDDTEHRCWPRKGEPPNITVGKPYYKTCSAGAGSILTPHWHGFLRDGYLVDC